jgi:hypothetical protein
MGLVLYLAAAVRDAAAISPSALQDGIHGRSTTNSVGTDGEKQSEMIHGFAVSLSRSIRLQASNRQLLS